MTQRVYGLVLRIMESMPDEDSRSRCKSAVRLRENALRALNSKDFSQAIEFSTKAIEATSDVARARPIRGLAHGAKAMAEVQMGRYSQAVATSSRAVADLQGHTDLLNELATTLNIKGTALLAKGASQESVSSFERAISIWKRIPGSESKISDCEDNLRIARRGSPSQDTAGRCWIVTAYYGDPTHPEVESLRMLRQAVIEHPVFGPVMSRINYHYLTLGRTKTCTAWAAKASNPRVSVPRLVSWCLCCFMREALRLTNKCSRRSKLPS